LLAKLDMTADEPAPTPFPPRRPSGTPSLVYLKLRGAPAATIICSSNGRTVFDDYWKQPGLHAEGFYDRYADVPIVHLSGWYDPYARTAAENFLGLSRGKKDPAATDPRSLDPW